MILRIKKKLKSNDTKNAKKEKFIISGWYNKKAKKIKENHQFGYRNLGGKAYFIWIAKNIDKALDEFDKKGFYDFDILGSKQKLQITKDSFVLIDKGKKYLLDNKSIIKEGFLYYQVNDKWKSKNRIAISNIPDYYLMIALRA